MVMRGFSEASGSWKIIWISLRTSRRSSCFMPSRSLPSQATLPSGRFTRPIMARAKVDLPQPDSLPHRGFHPRKGAASRHPPLSSVFDGCQNHCLPSLISKCTFRSAISSRTFSLFSYGVHSGSHRFKAGAQAAWRERFQRRRAAALLHGMRATRLEWTAFWQSQQVRWVAGNGQQRIAFRIQTWNRIQQPNRVWVRRLIEDIARLTVLPWCARRTSPALYRRSLPPPQVVGDHDNGRG